jgi:hypothetical protein
MRFGIGSGKYLIDHLQLEEATMSKTYTTPALTPKGSAIAATSDQPEGTKEDLIDPLQRAFATGSVGFNL